MPSAKLPRSRAGRARLDEASGSEDSHHWLTLAPVNDREQRIGTAMRIAAQQVDDGIRDYIAASILEYASTRSVDCEAEWSALLAEVLDEAGVPVCGCEADAADVDGADDDTVDVSVLLGELRRQKVVCGRPPPPPPLRAGDTVLAVLLEDGEWHEAVLQPRTGSQASVGGDGAVAVNSNGELLVRFVEWGVVQAVSAEEVQGFVGADGGGDEVAGVCELCERSTRLTFHHLIPKETHGRFVGKLLPRLPVAVLEAGAAPTKQWLSHYGAMLCRPCHTVVHRLAPNAVLAQRFNSVQALLDEPSIQRWCKYAAKSKC